ncbi:DNA-deoxyinosine glycosylase [Phenylobacterium sp.]|uniref:DNA-deoxyinosine glycosylase n=1 Tax=Phenylobacterium sp. TaxID=1871053 RepID=UPI002730D9E6|nr:DNA-deoxyinosine glycosylase [Phenylobacterium sp.]MDP1616272.1 DNA-deoxyinosine glycosylase [Phenylobacterium sp.]MDP1988869.1 DNA-deoxyinosine glycosylase [Phenylobacterium sp.]
MASRPSAEKALEAALKSSFPPVVDADTRLLILGSLPGEMSLQRGQYYANPRNQFWRLMATVTESQMPDAYDDRLAHLLRRGIGLWDTVKAARRVGSLDGAIQAAQPNALQDLAAGLPKLCAIGFNGGTAARMGRAQLAEAAGLALVALPSSSPAFTQPFEVKAAAWRRLRSYIRA